MNIQRAIDRTRRDEVRRPLDTRKRGTARTIRRSCASATSSYHLIPGRFRDRLTSRPSDQERPAGVREPCGLASDVSDRRAGHEDDHGDDRTEQDRETRPPTVSRVVCATAGGGVRYGRQRATDRVEHVESFPLSDGSVALRVGDARS